MITACHLLGLAVWAVVATLAYGRGDATMAGIAGLVAIIQGAAVAIR